MRRALCRATAKDTNRTVVELLRAMDEAGPAAAGDTVETLLAEQQADSRYWPDDTTLRAALREQPIYKNLSRPRLRMGSRRLRTRCAVRWGRARRARTTSP